MITLGLIGGLGLLTGSGGFGGGVPEVTEAGDRKSNSGQKLGITREGLYK
jgi:hypothetical protein